MDGWMDGWAIRGNCHFLLPGKKEWQYGEVWRYLETNLCRVEDEDSMWIFEANDETMTEIESGESIHINLSDRTMVPVSKPKAVFKLS